MVYYRRRRRSYARRGRRPSIRRSRYKRRSYRRRGRRAPRARSSYSLHWKPNRGAQGARRRNPQAIGMMPFPAEKLVTLRYDRWVQTDTADSVAGVFLGTYRCASIFAPYKTGTSSKAYLHDTWAAEYATYEVLSSTLKITINRGPKGDLGGGDTGPIVLGVKYDEDDASPRAPLNQWQRLMLDPTFYYKQKNIDASDAGPLRMRLHWDKTMLSSSREQDASHTTRVAFGLNPTQATPYWVVSVWPQLIGTIDEGAPGMPPMNVHVEILYRCRLSQRPDRPAYAPDGIIPDT